MKRLMIKATCALSVTIVSFIFTAILSAQPSAARMEIHFIDVGQADAILIMDDTKHCITLIDSGDTRYPDSSKNFREYLSESPDWNQDVISYTIHGIRNRTIAIVATQ